MQIAIVSTGVGTLLFLCAFLGFRQGLRLGMQVAKGQIPPKIRTPIEVVKQIVEDAPKSPIDKMIEGHARMMAYDGEIPKEER